MYVTNNKALFLTFKNNLIVQTFGECSCFEGIATKGYCPKDTECSNLNWFLALMMLGTLVSSTAKTGTELGEIKAIQ